MAHLIWTILFLLLVTPAFAYFQGQKAQPCDNVPPKGQYNEPVDANIVIKTVPARMLDRLCKLPLTEYLYGCWVPQKPNPGAHGSDTVNIYLNAEMNITERDCILRHERAEMPPNNWIDLTDPRPEIRVAR